MIHRGQEAQLKTVTCSVSHFERTFCLAFLAGKRTIIVEKWKHFSNVHAQVITRRKMAIKDEQRAVLILHAMTK